MPTSDDAATVPAADARGSASPDPAAGRGIAARPDRALADIRRGNACAGFSDEEFEQLANAAQALVDSRNTVVKLASYVGEGVGLISARVAGTRAFSRVGRALGIDLDRRVQELVETALWDMQRVATIGLDPRHARTASTRLHKAMATASGAAGGFFGAGGALIDVGLTTGVILRSIAEIAREHEGEDLDSDDTRRACIEVFAFGGPGEADDEVDLGFWATRLSLSHLVLTELIKFAAARVGITLSAKLLSQSVPVVGAVSGAGFNYAFIQHYQKMARVHFTLRALERRHGDPEGVRACFDRLVEAARSGRRLRPRAARPEPEAPAAAAS